MKEKQIKIQNTNIKYWEKGTSDVAVFFIHGNSLSKSSFINQFKTEHFSNYRLIAMDLPGNGNSDRLKNSDDYIQNTLPLLIEFIGKLKINKLIICGHSLGGHISFRLAKYINNKLLGICTIGTPPLSPLDFSTETPFSFHPLANLLFNDAISKENAKEWVTTAFHKSLEVEPIIKNILEADPNFRRGMREAFTSSELENEIELINSINKKVLLAYGTFDFTLNKKYIDKIVEKKVNKNRIVYIPNSGHIPHLEEYELFNESLVSYIQEVI